MSMTFEQWLKRPVYVAQCKTWKLANEMGVACHTFRCVPAYRDERSLRARMSVAQVIRRQRAMRLNAN